MNRSDFLKMLALVPFADKLLPQDMAVDRAGVPVEPAPRAFHAEHDIAYDGDVLLLPLTSVTGLTLTQHREPVAWDRPLKVVPALLTPRIEIELIGSEALYDALSEAAQSGREVRYDGPLDRIGNRLLRIDFRILRLDVQENVHSITTIRLDGEATGEIWWRA